MNEMTVTVGMTVLTEMPDINELAELPEWDEDSVITAEKNDTYYLDYPQYSEDIDYSYMDWLREAFQLKNVPKSGKSPKGGGAKTHYFNLIVTSPRC